MGKLWNRLGDGTQVLVIALSIATFVAAVTGGFAAAARSAEGDRYTEMTATIVAEPELFDDDATGRGVSALVATDDGEHQIVTAVDDQAQVGDTVTVYLDTDTGKLWRARAVGADPFTNPVNTAVIGFGTTLLVLFLMVVLAALGVRSAEHRREPARR